MWNEPFRTLTEPQRRGDATEAIVRAAFLVRGRTVLGPVSDNEQYDFVVDGANGFARIQVKTVYDSPNEGAIRFETRSTRVKSTGYERGRYEGAIDFFGVLDPETGSIYLVPADDAPKDAMTIRIAPAKNNNHQNVNWHGEYELDEMLDML